MAKSYRSISKARLYDYSDKDSREQTAAFLLDYARRSKDEVCAYWNRMKRYYDGEHDINRQTEGFYGQNKLPWRAAQSTDGYIHVETQIDAKIPQFEFAPRGVDDEKKAHQRRDIVKYILDVNDMEYKNSRNERSLGIYGSAVWKVCWDSGTINGFEGDVTIEAPSVEQIFTDPTARDVESCEYIGYEYKMHKSKAQRVFGNDLRARRMSLSECMSDISYMAGTSVSFDSASYGCEDDTVTITEWWFRQPKGGKCTKKVFTGDKEREISYTWESGDIGLCIFINGHEVRYVPKYWVQTSFKHFPFIIYNRIPNEKSIWGKSELEQIIPLIDAKDRELAFAQLNAAFNSNDIIIAEENAFCDGELPENTPGAIWKLRPGMMGKVTRMSNGASARSGLYSGCEYFKSLMEDTTGNFEVSQGKEPSNVTTASGIALLQERSQTRKSLKSIDRSAGFKRLYSLIDATALEFYDDGRVLVLSDSHDGEVFKLGSFGNDGYIPDIDVIIHTGSAAESSRALNISALSTLMSTNFTKDNYLMAQVFIDALDIPEGQRIKDYLESRFGDISQQTEFEFEKEIKEEV